MRKQKLREVKQVTWGYSDQWWSPSLQSPYSFPFFCSAFYILNTKTEIWTCMKRWVWFFFPRREKAVGTLAGGIANANSDVEGILFKREQVYCALSKQCDDAGRWWWKIRPLCPICFRSYLLKSFDLMLKASASQWRLLFDHGNSDVSVEAGFDEY